jgi:anti-sigma factor RsiW
MKITRDVVVDLWPVYGSGEASADTRALVEGYLAQDPELARLLREGEHAKILEPVALAPAPDHEMKAFARAKRALVAKNWPLFLAMMFSCLAFGRIVSDTSWDPDKSAWGFAVMAAIAAVFWVIFLVQLVRVLSART